MAITFYNHCLLILLTLHSFINLSSAGRQMLAAPQTSIDFIHTSCIEATYPELCTNSLINQANYIQTNPQLIANAALNVTLLAAKETNGMVVELSKGQGLQPREVQAVQDCVKELADTIDELMKSMNEMGQINGGALGTKMNNVAAWVTKALADESICTDGFEGKSSNPTKTEVRSKILTIAHLTSNALALLDHYAHLG